MAVALKKEIKTQSKRDSGQSGQEEATPQSLEEVLSASIVKVNAALQKLPPEKLAEAKKEAERLISGDLSWADLANYPPERLLKIAEMGYEQFQLGRFDSAERLFKGLTVIDPENSYYHQMLGATYQRKEQLPEAIVEYSVAVDLNKNDIVSVTNRGEVYYKLGVYELANADFDQAIGLDPKGEDKWANRARMLREQVRLVMKGKI